MNKISWIDDHGCQHEVSTPYAAELLCQLFNEWPGGLDEINASSAWHKKRIAELEAAAPGAPQQEASGDEERYADARESVQKWMGDFDVVLSHKAFGALCDLVASRAAATAPQSVARTLSPQEREALVNRWVQSGGSASTLIQMVELALAATAPTGGVTEADLDALMLIGTPDGKDVPQVWFTRADVRRIVGAALTPAAREAEPMAEVVDMKYNAVKFYRKNAQGDSLPYLQPGTKLCIAAFPTPPTGTSADRYWTQPGESLMGIALRQLKDESRWTEIRDLNAASFPDMGPHDYYPVGTALHMPPTGTSKEGGEKP